MRISKCHHSLRGHGGEQKTDEISVLGERFFIDKRKKKKMSSASFSPLLLIQLAALYTGAEGRQTVWDRQEGKLLKYSLAYLIILAFLFKSVVLTNGIRLLKLRWLVIKDLMDSINQPALHWFLKIYGKKKSFARNRLLNHVHCRISIIQIVILWCQVTKSALVSKTVWSLWHHQR